MNQKNLEIYYDVEDDTLEIFIGEPSVCYYDEIDDDLFEGYDEKTNELKRLVAEQIEVLKKIKKYTDVNDINNAAAEIDKFEALERKIAGNGKNLTKTKKSPGLTIEDGTVLDKIRKRAEKLDEKTYGTIKQGILDLLNEITWYDYMYWTVTKMREFLIKGALADAKTTITNIVHGKSVGSFNRRIINVNKLDSL